MTTEQFWRTRLVDFNQMVEGYQRRNRAGAVYFRELYSLLYNVNRGEKNPYLPASEVLLLPGEKRPRKPRARTVWDDAAIAAAAAKYSTPTSPTPENP